MHLLVTTEINTHMTQKIKVFFVYFSWNNFSHISKNIFRNAKKKNIDTKKLVKIDEIDKNLNSSSLLVKIIKISIFSF